MIQSLECRRLFVGFNDLLALANSTGKEAQNWAAGDFVASDDSAELADGKLSVFIGGVRGHRDNTISASVSKGGVMRVFINQYQLPELSSLPWYVTSTGTAKPFQAKVSDVKAVELRDFFGSTRIKLDESFPAAVIYLGEGNDFFRGNSKSSVIYGEKGDDTIYAGGGDDLVYGGEGNDVLYGEGGNDKLMGDAHKDVLDGGKGKNELIGGQGTDSFIARAKDKVRREDRDRVKVID